MNPSPSSPPALPKPKSWIERHLVAVIGMSVVGCFVALVLFLALIFVLLSGMIRKSEPYEIAFHAASTHPQVVSQIGEPVRPGFLVAGNLNFTGTSGDADLSIPIRGPNGRARIHVLATKTGGKWEFERLKCRVHGTEEFIELQPE